MERQRLQANVNKIVISYEIFISLTIQKNITDCITTFLQAIITIQTPSKSFNSPFKHTV